MEMLEGIDVKIGWAAKFLSGDGLAGVISAIALIMIALRLKGLEKISILLVQIENGIDEWTDALSENTKELKRKRYKRNADNEEFLE